VTETKEAYKPQPLGGVTIGLTWWWGKKVILKYLKN